MISAGRDLFFFNFCEFERFLKIADAPAASATPVGIKTGSGTIELILCCLNPVR